MLIWIEQREIDRQEALEKRYISALTKCFKDTKKVKRMMMDRKDNLMKRWMFIFVEMLRITPMLIE